MEVLAGVLQGSLVGPLLFLLFIRIGSSIRLFLPMRLVYSLLLTCQNKAAMILNTDLKQFLIGQIPGLMHLNASKTLSMIFSHKSSPMVHPSLFMHDTMLNETTNHKHLIWSFSF